MPEKPPHAICGAKTRSGKPCTQRPMANGRCRMHGGKSLPGIANPAFRHGRYSKAMPARLLERFDASLQDPELLALRADISLVDARLSDVLGRVDTGEAGHLWSGIFSAWQGFKQAHASRDRDKIAEALSEVDALIGRGAADYAAWREVMALIEQRRKLVESEQKRMVAMQQMITAEQAMTLIATIAESVRKNVRDRDALAAIQADISRITA